MTSFCSCALLLTVLLQVATAQYHVYLSESMCDAQQHAVVDRISTASIPHSAFTLCSSSVTDKRVTRSFKECQQIIN
jgi:hypothetical protein